MLVWYFSLRGISIRRARTKARLLASLFRRVRLIRRLYLDGRATARRRARLVRQLQIWQASGSCGYLQRLQCLVLALIWR
eukprot:6173348-Pleurochrysis_carterae.AAC.5